MKEAGYEWDAEKNELKKISVQSFWSEEDEAIIDEILNCLESCETHGIIMCQRKKEWLKSLKPRWKPTKEQLRAIINSAQGLYQCKEKEVLLDLYEQLKKL